MSDNEQMDWRTASMGWIGSAETYRCGVLDQTGNNHAFHSLNVLVRRTRLLQKRSGHIEQLTNAN
jgi:hypothetical protein